MVHAHVTSKSIKIICEYSKISGVYTQKKVICYSSSTQKTNQLKLITVLITFNLIDLFQIKTCI